MNIKNMAVGMIVLIVSVVLTSAMLVPVVSDATGKTVLSNEEGSLGNMTTLDANSDYSFIWSPATPTEAIINGEVTPLFEGVIIAIEDELVVRHGHDDTQGYWINLADRTGKTTGSNNTSYAFPVTVTVSSGHFSWDVASTSDYDDVSTDFTNGFALVKSGDYVMKSAAQNVYLAENTQIFGLYMFNLAEWNDLFQVNGTPEELTVTQVFASKSYTIENVSMTYSKLPGFDAIQSSDISFTSKDAESGATQELVFREFVVPSVVTVEKDNAPTGATATLISVVPLLVFVGLILGAVGMFITRRD